MKLSLNQTCSAKKNRRYFPGRGPTAIWYTGSEIRKKITPQRETASKSVFFMFDLPSCTFTVFLSLVPKKNLVGKFESVNNSIYRHDPNCEPTDCS